MKTLNNITFFYDLTTEKRFDLPEDFATTIFKLGGFVNMNFDDNFKGLFNKVYSKYSNEVIGESSFTPNFETNESGVIIDSDTQNLVYNFLSSYLEIYEETKEYYLNLLTIYKNNIDKLLDKVESIGSNKTYYNDTPQNSGGVFEEDLYTSTFNKMLSNSSTDLTTKMARIKEIQDSMKMVVKDWLKEFRQIFIEYNY